MWDKKALSSTQTVFCFLVLFSIHKLCFAVTCCFSFVLYLCTNCLLFFVLLPFIPAQTVCVVFCLYPAQTVCCFLFYFGLSQHKLGAVVLWKLWFCFVLVTLTACGVVLVSLHKLLFVLAWYVEKCISKYIFTWFILKIIVYFDWY